MASRIKFLFSKLVRLLSFAEDYQALPEILGRLSSINNVEEATEWLETFIRWLKKKDEGLGRYVRLNFFFNLIERQPEYLKGLIKLLNLLACESSFQRLLLQTGYSDQHNLIDEIKFRLEKRFLPSVEECDFYEVAFHVFTDEEDLQWLAELPLEVQTKFQRIILECQDLKDAFREGTKETLVILATQVANLGLAFQIRERSTVIRASKSPFLLLQRSVVQLTEASVAPDEIFENIKRCRAELQAVTNDMEVNGTSVALVYKLELLTDVLTRIEKLTMSFINAETINVHALLNDCVEALHDSRSILSRISRSSHLLSRKIAERNGESGERYIARTKEEKRELFDSSLKGGAVVLCMTVLKIAALGAGLPPLVGFFIVWWIYSGGFLLMQFTHSTLATKLPSFTASRLARLLHSVSDSADLDIVVEEFKSLIKSQLISFWGNIAALVPLTLAFHFLFSALLSQHFLSPQVALVKLESISPVFSWAVPMGAATGVMLWLSSLGGGWLENWIVFRKISRAVGENRRLRKLYGHEKAAQFGKWIEKNSSGIGANITLGFLFAFVPLVGALIGVPLDSQHVTISSTTAVLSIAALGGQNEAIIIFEAVAGLLLIGIANLTISFGLALFLAARATAIHPRRFSILMKMLFKKVFN